MHISPLRWKALNKEYYFATAVDGASTYEVKKIGRGQWALEYVRGRFPDFWTTRIGVYASKNEAMNDADVNNAADNIKRQIKNPLRRGPSFGWIALGIGAAAGIAALVLQTSAKAPPKMQPNTYPVTAGLQYTITIRSALDPTQWNAGAIKEMFPSATIAETGLANEWDLEGVAAASGSMTDDPPRWTITAWVEQAQGAS